MLDTHLIIWALTDDSRLSAKARSLILDSRNTIYYSIASLWEIAIKNYKYPNRCPYNESAVAVHCDNSGYLPLNINRQHVENIRNLQVSSESKPQNYDPFDRILIAQAKHEGFYLLSHDSNFRNYDEDCILIV